MPNAKNPWPLKKIENNGKPFCPSYNNLHKQIIIVLFFDFYRQHAKCQTEAQGNLLCRIRPTPRSRFDCPGIAFPVGFMRADEYLTALANINDDRCTEAKKLREMDATDQPATKVTELVKRQTQMYEEQLQKRFLSGRHLNSTAFWVYTEDRVEYPSDDSHVLCSVW